MLLKINHTILGHAKNVFCYNTEWLNKMCSDLY